MTILDEIFAHKRAEVARRRREKPLAEVQAEAWQSPPPLDFVSALRRNRPRPPGEPPQPGGPALIAEVKRASPSRGVLLAGFDPLRLATVYRQHGASAVSVLTDERFFKGHLDHLRLISQNWLGDDSRPPLLRKDFIFDPYQIYEARAAGADAVLLIVAGLEPGQLRGLHAVALQLGMAPLVEVHTLDELRQALKISPILIGVNNRNLRDFTVSLETTLRLRPHVPPEVCLVAESGIQSRVDVDRLAQAGVDAILVGEALVSAADVAGKVGELTRQDVVEEVNG